jgi:imidazolonepropionase-like amidohydrolase
VDCLRLIAEPPRYRAWCLGGQAGEAGVIVDDLASLYAGLMGRFTICEPGATVVVRNGIMVDGLGSPPRPNTTVVIKDGVIAEILSGGDAPSDRWPEAKVVDAAGATIMPGLVDAHFHCTGRPPQAVRQDLEPNDDIRPLRAARDLLILLHNGITAVKSMGHGRPGVVVALQKAMAEGFMVGPTIRQCGWAFSQTGGNGNLSAWPLSLVEQRWPRSAFADGIDGIRVAVRRNFGEGADFIKLYATQGLNTSPPSRMNIPNYTVAELKVFVEEANRQRTLASAHATGTEGCMNAVVAGMHTIEHGPDGVDGDTDRLLDAMLEHKTLFVPTLAFASKVQHRPTFTPEAKKFAAERYEGKKEFVRAAVTRGIPIAAGTDYSTRPLAGRNAEELVALHADAGLSALEAIKAGTSMAARAMGVADLLGSVSVGLAGDLIIVDGSPATDPKALLDSKNIRHIFKARQTWEAPDPL